jgi:ABC-type amino acid transport system permease subunit
MALGMTPGQTMRRVVLPQALRFAIPPMGNEFISMTKDSALVSATGFVHELMWRATKVGRAQFNNLEALIMAAMFYWIIDPDPYLFPGQNWKPASPRETDNVPAYCKDIQSR